MNIGRPTFVVVAMIASASALGATGQAGGGKPRCFGEPATHVFDSSYHDGNGTNGDDVIVSGAFITVGRGGDDLICGTGRRFQELYGDDGRDRIAGRGGRDTIDGGPGNDFGNGGTANDLLAGRGGNDDLFGKKGKDQAFGGDGGDICVAEMERQCED